MLKSKSFLAIDFGAGSLKLAEFQQNEAGGLYLTQYGIKPLGAEGSQDAARAGALQKALQEVFSEKAFGARNANICAPGYHVFSRFIKLPQVEASKVAQIIRYEAQQNVPFPLEEVVWDYQILGTTPGNELEVLLVAIKTDVVEALFRTADSAGLRVSLVDVSQSALCNSFRYNYPELEECAMLLDIGAKTSNVLLFEKGRLYSRGISIGANSITQDFANESKLKFPQAEAIKIEKGFVSLGGAYEEPEDPQAAAISKIARQVMTRLHLQINQTIQFYRSQGGSAPQRVFLSGGASIMPYTAQFFAEKLNVQVDYFNPFRNIEIAQGIDLEELSKHAHSFGEVVGLGLRELAHCPVEMNLMPKSSLARQEMARKKPFFVAAGLGVVLTVFTLGYTEAQVADIHQNAAEKAKIAVVPLRKIEKDFGAATAERDNVLKQVQALSEQVECRSYWPELLSSLRSILVNAETKTREAIKAKDKADVELGVWVEAFCPGLAADSKYVVSGQRYSMTTIQSEMSMASGSSSAASAPVATAPVASSKPNRGAPTQAASSADSSGEVSRIGVVFRGIDRDKAAPSANSDLAYNLREELLASGLFAEPIILGDIKKTETDAASAGTFSFNALLTLKRPLKL